MNIEEFKRTYMDEDEDVYGDGCEFVKEGTWEVDGKVMFVTHIYRVGDEYFAVDYSRDNSGYWSDGESYPAEVRKVKPITKTITVVEYVNDKEVAE